MTHGSVYWIKHDIRRAVTLSSEGICYWCGKKATSSNINKRGLVTLYDEDNKPFHLDHLIPVSQGGLHIESNLVVSCKECNCSKRRKKDENNPEIKKFMDKINSKNN